MKKKNAVYLSVFGWVVVFILLVRACCAETASDRAANIYDDWAHFGLGGCVGGCVSLLTNSPFTVEPLYTHNARTGRTVYQGDILKRRHSYDFFPGLLAGGIFEGLNWLRHTDHIDLEHAAYGMGGAFLADVGVGIVIGTW
jgi:hypothetical protein